MNDKTNEDWTAILEDRLLHDLGNLGEDNREFHEVDIILLVNHLSADH